MVQLWMLCEDCLSWYNGCALFPHTLDLVGDKLKTPLLASFCSYWISLFSHSPKTKILSKNQTGMSMTSYSKIPWWSKWEILHQIMLQFGDIEPFFDC